MSIANSEKFLEIRNKYLWIPVKNGAELKTLSIYDGDEKVYEFRVPADPVPNMITKSTDFIGMINVEKYIGKPLRLSGEFSPMFFASVKNNDSAWKAGVRRPYVHFTPDAGWMNDPNGLIFDGKEYHLYFQHNPLGKYWENMTWGHAVSTDLLHWEQRDDVMYPDEKGTMFSGSGLIDAKNTLGFGENAKVYFYTTAGGTSDWSNGLESIQCLAHSEDGGNTLRKDGMIIDTVKSANRDPKVYYYEPGGFYYMALFIAEPDEFAVLNSTDLRHWEETQRLHLPGLRECPDLRLIPWDESVLKTAGSDELKETYAFMAADGTYYTGSFDGRTFVPDGGMKEAFMTSIPYAAQTFFGPDRVIQVPWLRTKDKTKPYTSAMGLPRELTLALNEQGEPVILAKPVREFEAAKVKILQGVLSVDAEDTSYFSKKTDGDAAFELKLSADDLPGFELVLFDTDIIYDAYLRTLTLIGAEDMKDREEDIRKKREGAGFDAEKPSMRQMQMPKQFKDLTVFLDGNILELSVNAGREVWIYEISKDQFAGHIDLEARGSLNYTLSAIV